MLFIAVSAYAQSANFNSCMEKSEGITVNMLDCNADEIEYQDKLLNKFYKAAMNGLTPARKKQLQEAQRAWLKFRDTNCNFYADPDGGTSAALNSSSCFAEATQMRATELETISKN